MELRPGYKRTEVGVIPVDWEVKPLKHISPTQSVGLVINPSSYFDDAGAVPMLVGSNIKKNVINWESARRISDASNNLIASSRLAAGDLVTVRVGAPGITAVVPPELDGCNCASVMIVRQYRTFDSQWLCSVMNSPTGLAQVENVQYGTAQKQFNISDAVNFTYAVPPLSEQRAIAAALSDVDALINGLDQLIAKKRDLKQAVMQRLLTGQTPLPGFSGEWEVKRLADISNIGRGRVISHREISASINAQYPVYSSQTTRNGVMGWIDTYDFDGEYITWTTDGEKAGTPFHRMGKFNCTNVCGTIKLKKDNPFFIMSILQREMGRHVSRNLANPKLMNDVVKKIEIVIPDDLNEQTAIATVLSDMDVELAALEARRDKTRDLKQGMMQELLTGRIRLVQPELPVAKTA